MQCNKLESSHSQVKRIIVMYETDTMQALCWALAVRH